MYTLFQLLLSPGHILLWFQSPWCAQSSASEILMQLSEQLSSLFLLNMTQDSTQLLSSKYMCLLIGRIRFSSKCWCDQFVCLRRERSSHRSLDNKSSQSTHGRLSSQPEKACLSFPTPAYPKQEAKILIVLIVLQSLRHQRGGCNSRALCLVKAQGPCLCTAPHYLFDSWGTRHWNKTVAPWWESFHIIIRSRKQEITGRGRVCSSLSLCFASQ